MALPKFTLPSSKQRISIYGHTGCGKTQQAVWYLSKANIESMPWVVIDYKGDELVNSIPHARHIGYNDVPKKPGVHILHPHPGDNDEVEKFLWEIYARGHTGIYVDEGFMMPKLPTHKAYSAILVQGRSKHIPMINLTQKPFYVPMHMMSEADFHSVFHLTDDKDQARVKQFTGFTMKELDAEIPEYHSKVYRIRDREKFVLQPVPDADSLREVFAQRLAPKRRFI